jgi:hypothetical protein
MDGASHLYNSNIIIELLNGNSKLESFFKFNKVIVPNWFGHFILTVFNSFLPAYMAEKLSLIFYAVSFPLSFRYLVKVYNPENVLLSYLVFPFIYSALFYLGFYNFYLGIVLLLITTAYWLNNMEDLTLKKGFILFCLITIIYFCHLFIYLFLMVILSLLFLQKVVKNMISKDKQDVVKVKFKQQLLVLLLASFLSTLLAITYIIKVKVSGNNNSVDVVELFKWISHVKPIVALNVSEEEPYAIKYFYLISALSLIVIYFKIQSIKQNISGRKNGLRVLFDNLNQSDIWLMISIAILILFFQVPNGANAGMISERLCLLFFIFYIIWIASQPLPKWVGVLSIAMVLYCNLFLLIYHIKTTRDLSNDAVEFNQVSEYIDKNSVVLPFNYSDHWLEGHFSDYMGIDKPLILLENYEASLDWFPIKWNNNALLDCIKGHGTCNVCTDLFIESKSINYIVLWGSIKDTADVCNNKLTQMLKEKYNLIHISSKQKAHLYKVK